MVNSIWGFSDILWNINVIEYLNILSVLLWDRPLFFFLYLNSVFWQLVQVPVEYIIDDIWSTFVNAEHKSLLKEKGKKSIW